MVNVYKPLRPLLLLLILPALQTRAQSPSQDSVPAGLVRDLGQYRSQHLQEKIFVHTDKDFYLAGEICWFKLYDVDATLHRPLDLSKVACLEWLDRNNKPVLQTRIGLQEGHGDGSVYLPLTLLSGKYKLRAYTRWMKNFGAEGFFEKTITVVNARRSSGIPVTETPVQYKVAFFPEGGNLVENITSKIAFRATDQYGRGIEGTGLVTEDDRDTVARFRPLRFGIGNFMFTPRPGHRYRSTIRLPDGTAISNLLPAAYKEGTVMRVSGQEGQGNDRIRVDIQSSEDASAIYLVADTRQSVKFAGAAMLRDGKCSFLIDKDSLGEGISHLTVFNAAGKPLCERLVFKTPPHRLQIAMNTDKDSYGTRKKITLRVNPAAPGNKPVSADCSVSVFRLDSLQGMTAGHIESYLWLSSDLGGGIESPDYYFDHPEDEEAMDNLMMTHGWRRFRWEEVLRHTAPSFEFAPEYKGAIITGRVMDIQNGTPAKGVQVYFSVPGTRTQFSTAISDENGRIKFEMRDFYGGREIIVQTHPAIGSMYSINIDDPFAGIYSNNTLPPFSAPLKYPQQLSDKSIAVQVLNRFEGKKLKQFGFPAVDTSAFYEKTGQSYALDNYTRFTTMEEVMREYVQMILVQRRGGHFHLPVFDPATEHFFDSDPLILLDGVPVFNIDSLMTLDPLKMRQLDVVARKYFLGAASFDGIMNWISYKGDLNGYTLDPHAAVLDYEGLQLQREFYAPSYGTEQEAASHLPDFRDLLYWSPVVPMDSPGRGTLDFYSSDIPGRYLVIAEGLAADGTAGSGFTEFEVR